MMIKRRWARVFFEIFSITVVYSIGCVLSNTNNLLAFLWLACGCISIFLYFSISNHNLLDLRGILFASITGSVAVCQLRLSTFQGPWAFMTWICLWASMCCFCVGYEIIVQYLHKHEQVIPKINSIGSFGFGFQGKKVYYVTIFLAVMPIILFCIQVWIKGFIPIFEQRYDAYIRFYTRLSIFINLVMFSAPLAFWCLKNLKVKKYQRVILWLIIFLPTIIFQLMVQRGLFVWSICILMAVVYFMSNGKDKLFGVFLCAALLIFGVFFSSAMRGLSARDMEKVWKIENEIEVAPGQDQEKPIVGDNIGQEKPTENEEQIAEKPQEPSVIRIRIPTFMYAPYYYLINGLENFNNGVVNMEEHSYGLRQLSPFTVVLRFPALVEKIESLPDYEILENGSSGFISSDFYYDFGLIGVVFETLLLGALCALLDFFNRRGDFFAMLEYSVLFAVCLTGFFTAWISQFGTWLFAGTAFLIFLYVYLSKNTRKEI